MLRHARIWPGALVLAGMIAAGDLIAGGAEMMERAASPERPIVIAHRGASGLRPEHTIAAYRLAIEQGADYIEPDLVLTKDGVLIARHDVWLSETTDVAQRPEFADRRREVEDRSDWYADDFTLAEIKTLRARERWPGRSHAHDGRYEIPTFAEVIALAKEEGERRGRVVGIYPEAKDVAYYAARGMDAAAAILAELRAHGLDREDAPVFLQSFDRGALEALRSQTRLRLVQLVSPAAQGDGGETDPTLDGVPEIPLAEIAAYADAVGAAKALVNPRGREMTDFVARAHALGLVVHLWTLRDDAYRDEDFTSPEDEQRFFLALGVDGLFTDFPATGVRARHAK